MQPVLRIVAATVVLVAVGNPPAICGSRCPGNDRFPDPTGRWLLECEESTSNDTPHRLFLRNRQTGSVSLLLEFDRGVDALWAPDGSAIAITDHSGSSESEVYIFNPNRPTAPIDVEPALVASLGKIPELYENGHRYFEAQKWLTPSTLQFGVHAHDARPGVEYEGVFVFDRPSGRVRQVSR